MKIFDPYIFKQASKRPYNAVGDVLMDYYQVIFRKEIELKSTYLTYFDCAVVWPVSRESVQ